jgi:hypothetical protein
VSAHCLSHACVSVLVKDCQRLHAVSCCAVCPAGNRVTCRDWFQLTLKEGLTVFRDQGFSADMNSKAVKRIEVRACAATLHPTQQV